MIYQIITKSTFMDAFNMGRADQFSYTGLSMLYDFYLEEYSSYELDVISVCCEWSEYDDFQELMDDYGLTLDDLGHEHMDDVSWHDFEAYTICLIAPDGSSCVLAPW